MRCPDEPSSTSRTNDFSLKRKILLAGLLLIVYAAVGTWGHFDFSDVMGYYDLLADAFLKGQLFLDIRPEQGYLHDLIPYEGRYYLQWGPFPAALHAAVKLAGLRLSDRVACLLAGWLSSLVFFAIILTLRRRFFPGLARGWCTWFLFAFAFGTPTAIVALRGTVYHESIVVGALCVLIAFLASLRYQGRPAAGWALAAGLTVSFAVASRLSLAVYAVYLFGFLVAILYYRRESVSKALSHLAAYCLPIVIVGILQMAYNQGRFGSPWDYGNRYLPSYVSGEKAFMPRRIPENLGHYLFSPVRWTADFPWLEHTGWQPVAEVKRVEDMSSLLLTSPFLLLAALCWPLFRKDTKPHSDLRLFVAMAAMSSALMFLAMLCFISAARRYSQDFVPIWMILAFVGVALHGQKLMLWRRWRAAAWTLLVLSALLHAHLSFTQPFTWDPPDLNVMKTFTSLSPNLRAILPAGERFDREEAIVSFDLGNHYVQRGQFREAVQRFERASELMPDEPRIQRNLRLARERAQGR